MRILAIDAATEACSVALCSGGEQITRRAEGTRGHADRILPYIDEVLAEAGVSLAQLDGIAASVGPGAFTGVRISVAVAQGLAFGASLPVVPVTTLEALALEALEEVPGVAVGAAVDRRVAVACLDARMGEVYVGCYVREARRGVEAIIEPRLCAPEELPGPPGTLIGIGRGFSAYPALAVAPRVRLAPGGAQALPDARVMARLGILRLGAGEGLDPAALEPLYLRDRVALTEEERRAARTRPP